MHIKKKIVIAAAAVVAIGAGTAFAYWSTTGSGTGSGANASSNGTVVLHASFADGLTPGASTPVTFSADNAGTSSLQVGTVTSVVSASGTCDASWFTIAPVAENQTIAAGATGVELTNKGTLAFADTATNQDSCKGATITLTLSSN
ncbi:hypothetical protein EV646_108272 [Kribbella antiqua]|uniref:Camelysin-like metallo-endopeptidase n=1 Tax=Kribbella antiqua TaxID=2512217 RepID=A0A4R2INS9_9ACTN|nr:hypothetical protein [Kribbella antiqua]TCO45649.1 hypothetical protein EV646_108272 [Kribbella antiqua]